MDQRLAWFRGRAAAILSLDAPTAFDEALFSVAHLADEDDAPLARATVVTAVWSWYADANHSEQILQRLRSLRLISASATDASVSHGLILPACSAFRDGKTSFTRWWESDTIYWSFLAVLARVTNVASDGFGAWLARCWQVTEPAIVRHLIDLAARPWSLVADLPPQTPDGGRQQTVIDLLRGAGMSNALAKEEAAEPPELQALPELALIARECRAILTLDALLSELSESQRRTAVAATRGQRRCVGDLMARLTPYEAQLAAPRTDDDRLLEAIVTNPPNEFFMEHTLDGLPDKVAGRLRLPRWMRDYIIRGGHTQQAIVGATPYWFGVIDTPVAHPALATRPKGLTVEDLPQGVVVYVLIDDGEPSPLHVPFTFSRGYFATAATLALIAVRGNVRLDVLHLDRYGALAHVASHRLNLPDAAITMMRETALAQLRDAGIDSAGEFFEARRRETSETNDPSVGFDGLDLGKAEELVRPDDPELEAPELRVLELRDLRAQHLWRGNPTDEIDAELITAEKAGLEALYAARARAAEAGKRPSLEPLRTVTERVLPPGTSFVHLGLAERGVECQAVGVGAEFWIEDLEVGQLSSERVRRVVVDWVRSPDRAPDVLNSLIRELDTLGRSLADLVARRSLSRLILSPALYTHALPLHLAYGSSGMFLVDVVPSVVYARSLRMLDRMTEAQQSAELVAASFAFSADNDLPYALREAAVAGTLFGNPEHAGNRATISEFLKIAPRADLVHLAAHGLHVIGDHWSSGVALADGFLSSARVRQLRLPGSTVILAACGSGLAINHGVTRENFGGFDRAFLDAGAVAVVNALWEVEDFAGCLFTSAFMVSWREARDPELAMRDATKFLRSPNTAAIGGKLGDVLDGAIPDWRARLVKRDVPLSHPVIWGAFRLSVGAGGWGN